MATPKAGKKYLRIKAHITGYRRAGVAHSTTPTVHELDSFTPAQLAQLKSDRSLLVQEIGSEEFEANDVAAPAAAIPESVIQAEGTENSPATGIKATGTKGKAA